MIKNFQVMSKLNGDYKIDRDSIYVGEVIKPIDFFKYQYRCEETGQKVEGKLRVDSYDLYRSILFTKDEENFAVDLLYQSPRYPILSITDENICMNSDILVKDPYNLEPLLKYFGHSKKLSFEEILEIRKTYFSGSFGIDNCELFGMQEKNDDFWKYITSEGYNSNRKFLTYTNEGVLPTSMLYTLDARGNKKFYEVFLSENKKMNAFKPHKREGYIKKIRRF